MQLRRNLQVGQQNHLPGEICQLILMFCDAPSLVVMASVSLAWSEAANDEKLWLPHKITAPQKEVKAQDSVIFIDIIQENTLSTVAKIKKSLAEYHSHERRYERKAEAFEREYPHVAAFIEESPRLLIKLPLFASPAYYLPNQIHEALCDQLDRRCPSFTDMGFFAGKIYKMVKPCLQAVQPVVDVVKKGMCFKRSKRL